jgi:hypothetical protein
MGGSMCAVENIRTIADLTGPGQAEALSTLNEREAVIAVIKQRASWRTTYSAATCVLSAST